MTATEIIAEINALPPQGKEKLLQYIRSLDAEDQLSGVELTQLAEKLAISADGAEAAELRSALVRGFYGGKGHAKDSPPQPAARAVPASS